MDLLIHENGLWSAAPASEFTNEATFQTVVQDTFASVLASSAEVPAVVAREVVTPEGGRIDVVSIDALGLISICECKLDRNAGSRREVLGQVIEYGASLQGMDVDDFLERVTDALRRRDPTAGDADAQLAAQVEDEWLVDEWRDRTRRHCNAATSA